MMKTLFSFFAIALFLAACGSDSNSQQDRESTPYGYLSGFTFQNKKVYYEPIDGNAIVEGDILLGSVTEVENKKKAIEANRSAVSINSHSNLWSQGTMYYEIAANVEEPERITEAFAHINTKTGFRFIRRSNQADYVAYIKGASCSSAIGKRGGRQTIILDIQCGRGNIVHETLHALGLWHEQSRSDRANYINIIWANIQSGKELNFEQHLTDGVLATDYDFSSVMHYPANAFSKNGRATIVKKNGDTEGYGQRSGMSSGDTLAIKALYNL